MLLLCLFNSIAQAENWHLVKNEKNVQVYKMSLFGQNDRFLVQTTVKAPPRALLTLLYDLEVHQTWVENSLGVELIEQISANENIMRTKLKAPWPFKNRELISYSHYWQEPRSCSIFIDIKAMPKAIAAQDDFERIEEFQARWSSRPISKHYSLIRYSGWLDPGSYIPEFIASAFAVDSLFSSFENLRNIITLEQYHHYNGSSQCSPLHFYKDKLGK